jgi:hypothetical protein
MKAGDNRWQLIGLNYPSKCHINPILSADRKNFQDIHAFTVSSEHS